MSSTIFYRFKSQRDTSRILFDGTGLTVFDLKREIIIMNKLGDGSDFQLKLYSIDTGEELDEDQMVIPRSSSVIVKRSPAYKPASTLLNGASGAHSMQNATRYVTGKPRVFKKKVPTSTSTLTSSAAQQPLPSNMSEEQRIANMFATQANEWERTQEEMSSMTPIIHSSSSNHHGKSGGMDDGPPPPGYMCYRCGSRNHWIKNCPTNNDPNFEGKRIKRTTGIPKKFLQSVEIDPNSISPEEMIQRKIMITDEGKFVVQMEDKQSWEDWQRRQEKRNLQGKEEDAKWQPGYYPDLPRELKCPITGGIIRDAVKTVGCCGKSFSKNALEDVLLDNDFVCPSCGQEEVLLDSLKPDDETREKVKEYMLKNKRGRDGEEREQEQVKKLKVEQDDDEKKSPVKGMMPPPPPPPMAFPMPFPMPMFPFIPPTKPSSGSPPGK